MRRIATGVCLIMLMMAAASYAMGEKNFFPPVEYTYIQDREATHQSSGTGGTQPLLGNSLVPGSNETYEQWWADGDQNDPKRQHMQEIVEGWKQNAIEIWHLDDDQDRIFEIADAFAERVVGNLLSVCYQPDYGHETAPSAVFNLENGKQLKLSDLFYDGFNYIDYINTYLTQKPDQCYHTYWNENGPIEEMFKRPFPGLARDYPYFGINYPSDAEEIDDPLPVMLELLWTDDNPYWQAPMMDAGMGTISEDYYFVGAPLTHWASPYGECLIDVKLTPEKWQDFTFYAPHILIDQGRFPKAEKKINQALDKMTASFRKMRIPDAIDEHDFGYFQIAPDIEIRGQTLHVYLDVPTSTGYVMVFDGKFNLHTGERLMDIGSRMDGDEALTNLTLPFRAKKLGISQEEAALCASKFRKLNALDRLINGEIDLALVTVGCDGIMEQWTGTEAAQQADEAEDTWGNFDFLPIARDALVFVDRIENPVETLTVEQLREIYRGHVASWEEVGGKTRPMDALMPFGGTMAGNIFDEFVWGGDGHGGLTGSDWEQVNWLEQQGQEALGTLQWAERWDEGKEPGLRMLAVDGVAPKYQTVFDGSYPLSVTYYAVLRKGLPKDDPARQLTDWLLSDEGQRAMKDAGYAAVRELDE